ncbi:MAG: glycosyltransferase [Planctomycetota bacterium]
MNQVAEPQESIPKSKLRRRYRRSKQVNKACDGIVARVLVVGQTPPPFVGQWVMIEKMLSGTYQHAALHHVRMNFSGSVNEIGQFQLTKIFHLTGVVARVIWGRIRHNTNVLYYPPAGPKKVPVLRDIALLLATRWMFKSVVLHFHAGGVSEIQQQLKWPVRTLFRLAYHRATVGIQLTEKNPDDCGLLDVRHRVTVPNGITDVAADFPRKQSDASWVPTILFVGMLCEPKGLFVLLAAASILRQRGVDFRLQIVGGFDNNDTKTRVHDSVAKSDLSDCVTFSGVLTGDDKWRAYAGADIFCFPTHYPSESFGLVVIEAMMFGLPVVATDWRGVSTIVDDQETGYVVPIRDDHRMADRLNELIDDPALAQRFGGAGRRKFIDCYTFETFCQNMENAFVLAVQDPKHR